MKRTSSPCLMLALATLLAACGAGPNGTPTFAPQAGDDLSSTEHVEIRVVNLNYSDARLWLVVRRGQRHPLGVVTGKDSDTFNIPWHFAAPAMLEIDLIGGGRCRSDEMTLDPGDWIDFQIPVAFQSGSGCR